MTLRKLNVRDLNQFDLDFGAPIRARVADIGRSLGSSSIGLLVQTVQPGCQSSRRHRHIFQEEILVVMEGNGALLHGEESRSSQARRLRLLFGGRHRGAFIPEHGPRRPRDLGVRQPLSSRGLYISRPRRCFRRRAWRRSSFGPSRPERMDRGAPQALTIVLNQNGHHSVLRRRAPGRLRPAPPPDSGQPLQRLA